MFIWAACWALVGDISRIFNLTGRSSSEPKLDSYEISGFRYQAGLCTDWKFLRIIEKGYLFGGLSEYSVRAKIYVAHTSFTTPAPSWSINFGISANMLGWFLKR